MSLVLRDFDPMFVCSNYRFSTSLDKLQFLYVYLKTNYPDCSVPRITSFLYKHLGTQRQRRRKKRNHKHLTVS